MNLQKLNQKIDQLEEDLEIAGDVIKKLKKEKADLNKLVKELQKKLREPKYEYFMSKANNR